MNIYLIAQKENQGYDTFSDAVVAADCEDQARDMHPRMRWVNEGPTPHYEPVRIRWDDVNPCYNDWATKRENVTVTLLGKAAPAVEFGVLCASFHAG